MRYLLLVISILSLLFTLAGCSSSSNTPITPMGNEAANSFNALGVLGAYELSINPENNTAELVAKRTSAIGESYVVSGIGFFTISPCASCFQLKGISLTPDGNVELIFYISHPFEKGDALKPPSAANRLDLDVFDLALVIAPQEAIASTYSQTGINAYNDICVNADGYTTELDEVIEDGAALPYFLVIDDSIGGTSTYNKFEMGTIDFEFDAIFNPASDILRFDLYITMGYGWSARKPDRLNPEYYNPEFNRKAAWKVDVTPPEAPNTWSDSDNSTAYDVIVEVYDWQIGANVNSELTNPTDVYAASEVSNVSVEIPGMNNALQSVTTEDSGSGTCDDPLVYTVSIANENLLGEGEYTGLVKVTDERAVGAIGDRDFIIDSPDGALLEHFNLPEYATYQTFTAIVETGATACFSIGDFTKYYDGIGPDGTTDNPVPTEWDIDFDALCSEEATSYDWDLDGDGTYEGTGGPLYTGGFPAGITPDTYYPVLRINGVGGPTFTSTTGIVVETGVYVHMGSSAGGDGTKGDPYDTVNDGVAGAATPATSIILIRGDTDAGIQQEYNERVNLDSSHTGITLQGYSNDPVNSEPPAWRSFTPSYRVDAAHYWCECIWVYQADNVKIDGLEFEYILGVNTPGGPWDRHVRVVYFQESDNCVLSHIYNHNQSLPGVNVGWKPGYGVYALNCENLIIEYNLLYDFNLPGDWGGASGIYANSTDNLLINQVTIDDIGPSGWQYRTGRGVLIYNSTSPQARNTLVTRIHGTHVESTAGFYGNNGNTSPDIDYCDIWDINHNQRFVNDLSEGSNCINVGTGSDPLYVNITTDHHLQAGSPCIGSGEDGVDMGCYGGPGGDWNFED